LDEPHAILRAGFSADSLKFKTMRVDFKSLDQGRSDEDEDEDEGEAEGCDLRLFTRGGRGIVMCESVPMRNFGRGMYL
jgi:hypothetical protein